MSYDSFYCCFRTAQAPKILAGSGALPSETKIQLEKNSCNFAWQRQGETVLYCPHVQSTLAFENEQITWKGVSMEEAGNCVFSACRTIISSCGTKQLV
jgi:hypothetical protein